MFLQDSVVRYSELPGLLAVCDDEGRVPLGRSLDSVDGYTLPNKKGRRVE